MAIKTDSYHETSVQQTYSDELKALQAILISQGEIASYEEAADIGNELLSFFEALGEEATQSEANHA